MKGFMKRFGVSLCLLILLILSWVYIIKLKNDDAERTKASVVGTFMAGRPESGAEYFVFDQDGNYYIYKQGEPFIEKGIYKNEGEAVLLEHEGESREVAFINQNIYDFKRQDNRIYTYARIDDVPVFINVDT